MWSAGSSSAHPSTSKIWTYWTKSSTGPKRGGTGASFIWEEDNSWDSSPWRKEGSLAEVTLSWSPAWHHCQPGPPIHLLSQTMASDPPVLPKVPIDTLLPSGISQAHGSGFSGLWGHAVDLLSLLTEQTPVCSQSQQPQHARQVDLSYSSLAPESSSWLGQTGPDWRLVVTWSCSHTCVYCPHSKHLRAGSVSHKLVFYCYLTTSYLHLNFNYWFH